MHIALESLARSLAPVGSQVGDRHAVDETDHVVLDDLAVDLHGKHEACEDVPCELLALSLLERLVESLVLPLTDLTLVGSLVADDLQKFELILDVQLMIVPDGRHSRLRCLLRDLLAVRELRLVTGRSRALVDQLLCSLLATPKRRFLRLRQLPVVDQ